MKFKDFKLDERLLEGIDSIGFEKATPIQEQVIPQILEGNDVIASAQTGTGKTAAFLLPMIHKLVSNQQTDSIKAVVIVPTRELAIQIDQQMEGLSYFTPINSISLYGGRDGESFSHEKKHILDGAEMIICTPGKMIAHLNMGYVDFTNVNFLVLDEADRMLDMGFIDDIMKIVSFMPTKRQNLLFSATMPDNMRRLAKEILNNPVEVNIAVSKPAENVLQVAYVVYDNQKIPLVKSILKSKELNSALVFCSTKSSTKELARELKRSGILAEEIHSDLEQNQREEALLKFKTRKIKILVATDILSRGIDIEDIELIVNYDVPNDGEDYIHRIGRTARAESEGVAITLINQKDQDRFARIEKLIEKEVYKVSLPPELGEAPKYSPRAEKSYKKHKFSGKKKKK